MLERFSASRSPLLNVYRFKNVFSRTLLAFLPGKVDTDDTFAAERLDPVEYGLYLRMDPRDRHHACVVTQSLLARVPDASPALQKAALLHDVGKSVAPYNATARILVHLYTPEHVRAAPPLEGWRGAWQLHRHHDRYGAEMIRRVGGSERVAQLVERHHDPQGDEEAELLKAVDEGF